MPILDIEDKRICYEATGDKSNPCVILITGITGQLVDWPSELVDGLVASGFYVVTFDNRDVGKSSYYDHLETPSLMVAMTRAQRGEHVELPYSLGDMADDIVSLMNGLEIEKAHIAGASMGGQIAQLFVINHPERTLGLTLMFTSSGDRSLPPPSPEVMDYFSRPKGPVTDLETALAEHITLYKIHNHPGDFDIEDAAAGLEKAYSRAYHPEGNLRQLLAMLSAEPRTESLKELSVPALVFHGDYDPVFSIEHGKQLAECLRDSHLEVIENMGHALPKRVIPELVRSMSELAL